MERLRKRRLKRKIINATIITKITNEALDMGRLKNFSSKYILFVCIFQFLFKNMGGSICTFNAILCWWSYRGRYRYTRNRSTSSCKMVIIVFSKINHYILCVFRKFSDSFGWRPRISGKRRYYSFWRQNWIIFDVATVL